MMLKISNLQYQALKQRITHQNLPGQIFGPALSLAALEVTIASGLPDIAAAPGADLLAAEPSEGDGGLEQACFVCMNAAADAVLIDCGHGGLCAGEVRSCPALRIASMELA